ncbi:MAG: hypothetical protein ACRDBQ_02415 [Shewanella sp.]
MTKAELIHAIVAASGRLGIEPMTEGTNAELEAHLASLSQRIADLEAETGGNQDPQTGGGTTQPDPKALVDGGIAEPQTGGGTTQPDPKVMVNKVMVKSSLTIETKRGDGSKLRLVADEITAVSADDYELIKALDYVQKI